MMCCPSKNILGCIWTNSYKFRIYKNVIALSSAFFLLFAAFQAISTLQTSINAAKGLGSVSLSVIYAFFILSCIFLPNLFITFLGIKWTLFWCIVAYSTFIAANFKPTWFSLIPTSSLLGLAAGPLWTSQSVYITALGKKLNRMASARQTIVSSPPCPYKDSFKNVNLESSISNRAVSHDIITSVTEPYKSKDQVPFLFGIFFAFFQMGTICGQLISSMTLRNDIIYVNKTLTASPTLILSSLNLNSSAACGIDFCSNKGTIKESNMLKPSTSKLYTLYSIYTGLALLAALVIAIFLDNVNTRESDKSSDRAQGANESKKSILKSSPCDEYLELVDQQLIKNIETARKHFDKMNIVSDPKLTGTNEQLVAPIKGTRKSSHDMCFATLHQMRKWEQLCLIPLSIYGGLQKGFMSADFTKAFIACNHGVGYVGYAMIVYASVNACISPFSGLISQKVPRWTMFLLSALIHTLGVFPFLTIWSPVISRHFTFTFVGAALFGIFDGLWQPQINGLYGALFQDNPEPAFANHSLWSSIGFIIILSSHNILCLRSKLICLALFLALSSFTYTILIIRLKRQQQQQHTLNL